MGKEVIDFVVTWVDNNDPVWQQEFKKWYHKIDGDKRLLRFRDWGTLRYQFRCFEKFAPWVNKIHLVTCGHRPGWLNAKNPKLQLVKHQDFLDEEHLPLFNSRAIEIKIHLIPNLAEKFVYFNDDMFLLQSTDSDRFFEGDLPKDIFALTAISPSHPLAHININNLRIINNHFNKRTVMKKHFKKWFCFKFGIELIKTILLLPWPSFTGFFDPHQPQPYLKSTFNEVWSKEYEILLQTSRSKFRNDDNVNPYLFRYWQLAKGKFAPVGFRDTLSTSVYSLKDAYNVANIIRSRRFRMVCINDGWECPSGTEFQEAKKVITEAFGKILPNKSSFEL